MSILPLERLSHVLRGTLKEFKGLVAKNLKEEWLFYGLWFSECLIVIVGLCIVFYYC